MRFLQVSLILRGANDFMLDEMDRALHDALCIVKRTLESNTVSTTIFYHAIFPEAFLPKNCLFIAQFICMCIALVTICTLSYSVNIKSINSVIALEGNFI